MEYMNSTYASVATLLPYQLTPLLVGKTTETAPVIIHLDPWSTFDKLWTMVMGYSAAKFEYTIGQTPMSTMRETFGSIALYYLVIFGGREVMRNRPAFKLNTAFLVHNFYLTAISGGLLVLFLQQLIPGLWRNGLLDGICGETGWTRQLVVLYYLNYLTKYLELLDTVFLVLKKKPLTFLHTYHHGATAALCYTQLRGNTSVSWVPIVLNLTVHVVMYWYYFQSARGQRVWWKKYITVMQITQFVIDLGVVYFATYTHYAHKFADEWLPNCGSCRGEPYAAFSGCAILTSYLFLFIGFYMATYKQKTPKDTIKKAARRYSKIEVPTVQEASEKASDVLQSTRDELVQIATDNMGSSLKLSAS